MLPGDCFPDGEPAAEGLESPDGGQDRSNDGARRELSRKECEDASKAEDAEGSRSEIHPRRGD